MHYCVKRQPHHHSNPIKCWSLGYSSGIPPNLFITVSERERAGHSECISRTARSAVSFTWPRTAAVPAHSKPLCTVLFVSYSPWPWRNYSTGSLGWKFLQRLGANTRLPCSGKRDLLVLLKPRCCAAFNAQIFKGVYLSP